MENYLKLKSNIPGQLGFAYIDRREYLADNIFMKYGIRPIFRKGEWVHPDYKDYCLVMCHVRKKHKDTVLKVFQELADKMLVLGHTEYPQLCEGFQEIVRKEKKRLGKED